MKTLSDLGVSPSEAVHIGDDPRADIAGANGVGMRTIRVGGPQDASHGSEAEVHVDSIGDVAPALRLMFGL